MGAGEGKRWWGRLLNHDWLISIIASAEMLKVKAAAAAAAEVVATSSIHPPAMKIPALIADGRLIS